MFNINNTVHTLEDMQRRFSNSYLFATIDVDGGFRDYVVYINHFSAKRNVDCYLIAPTLPIQSFNDIPSMVCTRTHTLLSWDKFSNIRTVHTNSGIVYAGGQFIRAIRTAARRTKEGISNDTYHFTTLDGNVAPIEVRPEIAVQLFLEGLRLPTITEAKLRLTHNPFQIPISNDVFLSRCADNVRDAFLINCGTVALGMLVNNSTIIFEEGQYYTAELENANLPERNILA